MNNNYTVLYSNRIYKKLLLWYILCLIATGVLFASCAMKPYLYIMGIASVALFTFGVPHFYQEWNRRTSKQYEQQLFILAFIIRLVYVIFIYNFNISHYGTYAESNPGDTGFYQGVAMDLVNMKHRTMSYFQILRYWKLGADDCGDVLLMTYLFKITGVKDTASSVIVALIFKSILGALTCIFSYRIATRHFDEEVGRGAGLFCVLYPNMIWWCGSMMKETEMVFCTMVALNSMDRILFSKSLDIKDCVIAFLTVASTFFFRTVLGLVLVLSLCAALICMRDREVGKKKKYTLIVIAVFFFSLFAGNKLYEISKGYIDKALSSNQENDMEFRSQREGGNSFAKYAGAAVFAPMIFTIPFPTMVYTQQGQEMQMQVNGGNYLKNIFSFFVILSLFSLLISKKWNRHSLLLSFVCGYLLVLVFSKFAQSGRFHMPIMPVFMIFAAYGMTLLDKKTFKLFKIILPIEFVICIAWSWYKLAGRGLI